MNTMYYNKIKILEWIKIKVPIYAKLETGNLIPRSDLKYPLFEIECCECYKRCKINFYKELNKRVYKCQSCQNSKIFKGKRHSDESLKKMRRAKIGKYDKEKNPFYGKHHTSETIKKLSEIMSQKYGGGNSPFYGRHHTPENLKILSEKHREWWKKLNEKHRSELLLKISTSQKKLQSDNPQLYKHKKQKAAKASCLSIKRYQKNKIEQIVENKFKEWGLYPKYSVILGYKQYDFGFKDERILLEVQGDYWHANPKFYDINKLNYMQIENLKKDKDKQLFALNNNFKLYYIWEDDINNNNFEILEKIKYEIQTNNPSR